MLCYTLELLHTVATIAIECKQSLLYVIVQGVYKAFLL